MQDGAVVLLNDERGVTLVEMIMALLVLMFVSLALMQTALVSIEANMKNVLRDEAIGVADARMSEARSLPFTQFTAGLVPDAIGTSTISADVCPPSFWTTFGSVGGVLVQRNLRNWSTVNFCTNRNVIELGGDFSLSTPDASNRQITITVGWSYKGQDYSHALTTIVGRQSP